MKTSYKQLVIMVDFMEQNGDLLRIIGGPKGRYYCMQKWAELTQILNNEESGDARPEEKWRESEQWLTYESLKEEIQEKIRKLEEERHTVELWPCTEWGRRRRKRQVTVSPPYVVYMLPDADIMEDWRLVKNLLEKTD